VRNIFHLACQVAYKHWTAVEQNRKKITKGLLLDLRPTLPSQTSLSLSKNIKGHCQKSHQYKSIYCWLKTFDWL